MAVVCVCLAEAPAGAAQAERFELRLGAGGSDPFGFSTADDRLYAVFGEGACRPMRDQTAVRVDVQPLDPANLGALPAGLRPAGPAYRLRVSYVPSGRPIEAFSAEVTVGLVYPRSELTTPGARTLLHSGDAKGWTQIPTSDVPNPDRATGRLPAPGYVLVAVPSGLSAPGETAGDRLRRLLPLVLLAVLVIGVLVYRRRRARKDGERAPADRPPAPPARPRQRQAGWITSHDDAEPTRPRRRLGRRRPRR